MPLTKEKHDYPPTLTYEEVAHRAGVSKSTVGRLVRSGRLAAVRFGPRSIRVSEHALERFMQAGGIGDDE